MVAKKAAGEVTLGEERVNDHLHPATTEDDPTLALPDPFDPTVICKFLIRIDTI